MDVLLPWWGIIIIQVNKEAEEVFICCGTINDERVHIMDNRFDLAIFFPVRQARRYGTVQSPFEAESQL
uniref:Uncharacterized protein n=1 Tax=Romanomermis culicivorax TaxID=13658 RepID=A0A915IA95_ROMCU